MNGNFLSLGHNIVMHLVKLFTFILYFLLCFYQVGVANDKTTTQFSTKTKHIDDHSNQPKSSKNKIKYIVLLLGAGGLFLFIRASWNLRKILTQREEHLKNLDELSEFDEILKISHQLSLIAESDRESKDYQLLKKKLDHLVFIQNAQNISLNAKNENIYKRPNEYKSKINY